MKYAVITYSTIEEVEHNKNPIFGSGILHFQTVFRKALVEIKKAKQIPFDFDNELQNSERNARFYLTTIKRILAYTGKRPPTITEFGVAEPDDIFEAESDDDAKLYFEMKEA